MFLRMLENTFAHLPGITPESEERLWSMGFHNWDQLEENLGTVFSAKKLDKVLAALEESRAALDAGEFLFFQERLKGGEKWRCLPSLLSQGLQNKIAHLDIESTGLGFPPASYSTSIAVLFDGELHVEHEFEKKRALMRRVQEEALCLVTFNGASFDLPFLRREFELELRNPHVDLRYWFAKHERKGGLKKIQTSFDEVRQRGSMDIDGFDAVRLWRMHEWGVERALETLMTYNAEDTVVLEQLMYCLLNLEAAKYPHLRLASYDIPTCPEIRTTVCSQVYRRLRGEPW